MNKIKKSENPDCTLTLVLLLKWKKVFLKGRIGVLAAGFGSVALTVKTIPMGPSGCRG